MTAGKGKSQQAGRLLPARPRHANTPVGLAVPASLGLCPGTKSGTSTEGPSKFGGRTRKKRSSSQAQATGAVDGGADERFSGESPGGMARPRDGERAPRLGARLPDSC